MALTTQQRDQLASALASRGYNQTDARNAAYGPRADELAKEYGVNTGADPGSSVNQMLQDSFQKLINEANQRYGDYRQANPFVFDEVLSQKTTEAKEQIDPYYNETLGDYLTGVQRKIQRGEQDTRDLLAELNADTSSFTRDLQFSLNENLNKAREGYAGAGLFDSGQRLRQEGILGYEAGNKLGDFTRGQQFKQNQLQTGLNRSLEDIALGKKQDVRNLERSRYTDIGTRAGQLTKEAGQQYVSGFRATLPPELQAASGFDLLQDLGIYS